MKKILLLSLLFIALLSISITAQEEEHDFTKTRQLIDSEISCTKLTNEQLEEIGDYYMEQMHPGEAHEYMDRMMGGEGSESLKQVHINLARRIYCNENIRMMGNYYQTPQNNNPYQNNFSIFQIFFYVILTLVIIVIILIIILLISKSKRRAIKK